MGSELVYACMYSRSIEAGNNQLHYNDRTLKQSRYLSLKKISRHFGNTSIHLFMFYSDENFDVFWCLIFHVELNFHHLERQELKTIKKFVNMSAETLGVHIHSGTMVQVVGSSSFDCSFRPHSKGARALWYKWQEAIVSTAHFARIAKGRSLGEQHTAHQLTRGRNIIFGLGSSIIRVSRQN